MSCGGCLNKTPAPKFDEAAAGGNNFEGFFFFFFFCWQFIQIGRVESNWIRTSGGASEGIRWRRQCQQVAAGEEDERQCVG